ncbi:glycosyltransferase family 4 protein [bacterium]|nr:glycosyltransferase family 4 protein [bacterium]NUP92379.1 glycosyltransferase family 4 protein [Candidatus Omnitrophota bacterium]
MRILFLNHNVIGRGSFLRCLPLADELHQRGHEVVLVTTADSIQSGWKEENRSGVKVWVTPRWGKTGSHDGGYALVDILSRLGLLRHSWDLVHAFEHRPNVTIPGHLLHLSGIPLVSDWSDWWTKGGITTSRRRFKWVDRLEGSWIEEGTRKHSDAVTVVSQTLYERAIGVGVPPDRLFQIPSGCDHRRITPLDQQECRRRLGLPSGCPIVCFSGFAFWDFAFLLDAYRWVLDSFPETRFIVIGSDKEGQIESLCQARLGERAGQVHQLGVFHPDEISLPLSAADIHLLPLPDNLVNRARWPIKFGDYLCSGRPMVACRVGDAVEWLPRFNAGLVSSPDPEDMAARICELLSDETLRRECGARARELACGPLSWGSLAERFLEVYEKCLGNRTR